MKQEQMEQELEQAVSDGLENKYLSFFTDGQLFGVPIAGVDGIMALSTFTRVPDYPDYVKGVIDLRGEVVPLIDIRLRFGKPEAEYNERTCIIVVRIGENGFGFIVDGVDEVSEIGPDAIMPPPKLSEDGANRYLTGITRLEDKIVLLLDPAKILNEQEFSALAEVARR